MRALYLLLIFISISATGQDALLAPIYYEQALQHSVHKEYVKSENKLLMALEIDPKHLPSRILIADIYLRTKKPLKTLRHLKIALDNNGDKAILLPMIAEAKLMLGLNKEALDILVSQNYDKTVSYYNVLGRIHLSNNDFIEAEKVFDEGLKISVGNKNKLLLGLAEVYFSRQEYDKLEIVLFSIPASSEDHKSAQILLAESYYKAGKLVSSLAIYEKLYGLNEKTMGEVYGYINVLIASNEAQKAKLILQKELELHNGDVYLMLLYATLITNSNENIVNKETLALILDLEYKLSMVSVTADNERHIMKLKGIAAYLKNDTRLAKKYLKMYVEYNQSDKGEAEVSFLLSNLYFNEGRFDRALTYVSYAYEKNPGDYRVAILYSKVGRALDDNDLALQLLKTAHNRIPDNNDITNALILELINQKLYNEALLLIPENRDDLNPLTWLSIGYVQLETKRINDALKTADYISGRYGLSAVVAQFIGEVSLKVGKEGDALRFFVIASDKQKDFKAPLFSLAGMHLNKNEYLKADEYYSRILSIDPKDTLALQLSADALIKLNDIDRAIEKLEVVNKFLPDDIAANRALIKLYIFTKKYDLASALLGKLMAINKVDQALLYTKVELNQIQGRLADAKESLNVLYGLNYDNPAELLQISNIYSNINANKELRKSIDRLKSFNVYEVEIAILEAKYNKNRHKFTNALKFINAALLKTSNRQVQLLKAIILLEMNDYTHLNAYLESIDDGYDEDVLKLLLRSYSLTNNDKKVTLLEEWVNKNPRSIGYIALLALEYEKHSVEKAIDLYKKTLDKVAIAEFAYRLSYLISDKSLFYSKRALDIEPDNHVYLDRYGWILIEQGEVNSGLGFIREALARQRNIALYQYHAAFALYKLKRYIEAESLLKIINLKTTKDEQKKQVAHLLEKIKIIKGQGDDGK